MTTVTTESRRERKAAGVRARIESAALALFRERGFAGTSVDAIVARADVAKGTFFIYFAAKPAVLERYYRNLDAKFFDALRKLDEASPEASMARYYRTAEKLLREEGALARVLFDAIASDPRLGGIDRTSGEDVERRVAAFLDSARLRGTVRRDVDAALAARVLTEIWSATVRDWLESGQASTLAAELEAKAHLLFAGLDARASRRASRSKRKRE